jgi:hypothetical protein
MDRTARDYPVGNLRVSDADRDGALSELTDAFQVGRITADEFDQRSGQVLRARTGAEIAAVLNDLPRTPPVRMGGAPRGTNLRPRDAMPASRLAAGAAAVTIAALVVGSTVMAAISREHARNLVLARLGLPPVGFDWGAVAPGGFVVAFILLIVLLRVMRPGRRDRRW